MTKQKYQITFVCQHVETVEVEADNVSEAIEMFKKGEETVLDWHLEGDRFIGEITKEENGNIKQLQVKKEYNN